MKYWWILFLSVGAITACKSSQEILYIAPQKQDCIGLIPMECFLVKKTIDQPEWEYFYENIQGFNFEEGYAYKIKVKVKDLKSVPADASSKEYILLKLIEKKKTIP